MYNKIKSIIGLILLLLVIVGCGRICGLTSKPKPIIVSSYSDDLSSRLGEYSMRVWAEIRNDGGDGDIVMEVTVKQGNNKWKKSIKRFFEAKQTSKLELIFDEIDLLGKKAEATIEVYTY